MHELLCTLLASPLAWTVASALVAACVLTALRRNPAPPVALVRRVPRNRRRTASGVQPVPRNTRRVRAAERS